MSIIFENKMSIKEKNFCCYDEKFLNHIITTIGNNAVELEMAEPFVKQWYEDILLYCKSEIKLYYSKLPSDFYYYTSTPPAEQVTDMIWQYHEDEDFNFLDLTKELITLVNKRRAALYKAPN